MRSSRVVIASPTGMQTAAASLHICLRGSASTGLNATDSFLSMIKASYLTMVRCMCVCVCVLLSTCLGLSVCFFDLSTNYTSILPIFFLHFFFFYIYFFTYIFDIYFTYFRTSILPIITILSRRRKTDDIKRKRDGVKREREIVERERERKII